MQITLPDDATERMIASIRRYFAEEREEEIGELQAKLLLDFFLAEIAPSVYNAAVGDAQTFLRDRIVDLEGACFVPEFGYWPPKTNRRPTRK